MLIKVDVDEVLRQFVKQLQRQYSIDFPNHFMDLNVTSYDLAPFFELGKDIRKYFNETRPKEIYTMAEAFMGAGHFMWLLQDAGHEVWAVSNQARGNEVFTLEWLYEKEIPCDSICFTRNKSALKGDVILDDCVDNLRGAEKGCVAIAMDRPWNQDWKGLRAKSLLHAFEIIQSLT